MVSQSFHILGLESLMPRSSTAWLSTAMTRLEMLLNAALDTGVISWAVLICVTTRTGPRSLEASRMSSSSSSTRWGVVTGTRVPRRFMRTWSMVVELAQEPAQVPRC